MPNVSHIEIAAFALQSLWCRSLDQRDELGQLIITKELEESIDNLNKLVKEKRAKMGKGGAKRGRKAKELPSPRELRLQLIGGKSITKMASELGVDRKTISNRIRQNDQRGIPMG